MKNLIAFALIAALLLAPPFASATVSEVTAEASSSSVTTGTSVTVTSAVTATESETTSIQLVSSPSGITVSDPASGSYSSVAVSTTPVTKTFTITAGSAGTYTYYAQAGSTQSTAKTIVFSDPSILTITGDSSAVTKSAGDTLTLSITLTNSQASAITSYYSLSLPSGFSVTSGDPQTSAGRSFAVGTTTLSWTISIASGASTGAITFQLGSNTNAFSKSVTIPTAASATATTTTTTATSSDGSTSTTIIDASANKVTKRFSSMSPYVAKIISETELKDTKTGLTRIEFSSKKTAVNVKLTVQKLESKPASITSNPVSADGSVYRYVNITKENLADADMDKAKINFKVEKSWLSANNFTASQIALKRFVSQWEKLNTTLISQDGNYSYYAADSPGFSIFAVAADKDIVTPEQPAQPETPEQPTPEQPPQPEQQPAASNAAGYIVAMAVILIIAAVALYFADKKGLIKMPRKI